MLGYTGQCRGNLVVPGIKPDVHACKAWVLTLGTIYAVFFFFLVLFFLITETTPDREHLVC